ncbi:MAG TPA: hypothetical protein VMZ06_13055 [Candidatus Bathyarchaeia archaeon]|nr:hypothetical protein [Candidatus Bathyarchaeia archaeon]
MCSALAAWLLVFIHEAVGHCLIAQLFGCVPYGFYVSPFFAGYASAAAIPPDLDGSLPLQFLALQLGGIIANILTGSAACTWVSIALRRGNKRRGLLLFVALFGLFSVVGQTIYAFVGFVYGLGDSPLVHEHAGFSGDYVWLPFLLMIPFVSYLFMVPYVKVQAEFFPIQSPSKRLTFAILTLGSIVALFFALFVTAFVTGYYSAIARAVSSSRIVKYEVRLLPAAAFLYLLVAGAFTACWRTKSMSGCAYRSLSIKNLVWPMTTAVSVGVILVVTGGSFQWPRFGAGLPPYPGEIVDKVVDREVERDFPLVFDADADGYIHFSDTDNGTLCRLDPATGEKTVMVSDLQYPVLVCVSGDRVYFLHKPQYFNEHQLGRNLMSYDLKSGQSSLLHNKLVLNTGPGFWRTSLVLAAHGDRVLAVDYRRIAVVAEDGGESETFAELPAGLPGEIHCAAEGSGGALYVAAGERYLNEQNVLLRYTPDGSSFTKIAEGLSLIRHMKCDANGDLYLMGAGRSSLILVRDGVAAGGNVGIWELKDGWNNRLDYISTPYHGSCYYLGERWYRGSLHRLTIKER